ncbi:prolyl-tRNA synthetase associated domain-containing protein [Terrisporobacter glycolicus]|uniref:Prolyl-tRNA editing protein ProX n=1 Tax=Terrisporobacter glycolicus ATCC 14880 = DSM 1288 TaxID=1121315 RepID=A0ABZ2ETC8_9FIRM|nr:prolyl-tRNA synthetase associated domain-containing protein [Terrisporobacter glycolicus]
MDKKEQVLKKLDELNIKYEIVDHPPVYTIEEAENLNLEEKENMVKNLFLKNSNGKCHYLVVLKGDKKADLKSIRSQIQSSALSFASEERLEKHLNLLKGAVTPLGIINDEDHCVNVVIDDDLKNQALIGVHPNVNTSTVFISYNDMIKFINSFGNEILYVNI